MAFDPLKAASGVVGSIVGGIGANNAAKAQQAAANNAKRMARSNFLLGVGLNEVPRALGYGAYADIANQFGYALPAYQTANELAATMNPLTAKQVKGYVKMGMGADQIASIGTLGAMSPKSMKRLMKAGLTQAEIQQLATRQPQAVQPGPGGGQAAQAGQSFIDSPDYQFRRDEGQRDIGNSFAARGGAASGNALRALTQFNQNLAASEFGNWFNRRMQLSGRGDMANNNIQTGGTQYNRDYGQAQQQLGDARASGILGVTGAIQGGLSGVASSFGSLGKYMPTRGYSGINPSNYPVPNAPISRPIDLQPMFPFGG